ncbi:hypothetical protein [Roseateles violae]|uniref:Uncharacterized protein n=1 Tax=Roseateles violae TaxID=3058042 RepID=A0ABT8DVB4_9BURK|nr:hypothetical protein [Pelomonas sp. PFR6]MDN3922250.1 hypothetical protein [Pelomonas sp. PFR6]
MQDLLNRALDQHAEQPAAAAATLAEALSLTAKAGDEELLALLRTAEHVLLGHLADGAALRELLAALPERAALRPALQRIAAALSLTAGESPLWQDLAPAERVRAHYNAALARTRRGDLAGARRLLDAAQAQAGEAGNDAAAQKALAALANNVAGDLRYYHRGGDADYDTLMLDAAALALAAWTHAGGWLERERAEWQLALCAAAAGRAEQALAHARQCLRICEEQGADAFERFFAHEAIARAAHAGRDPALARQAREQMAALLARLPEADRVMAVQSLAELDARLAR